MSDRSPLTALDHPALTRPARGARKSALARPRDFRRLAEAAGNVVFSLSVFRLDENRVGVIEFDQLA